MEYTMEELSAARTDLFSLAEAVIMLFNGQVFNPKQTRDFYILTGEKYPCHAALKRYAINLLLAHGDKSEEGAELNAA